MAKYYKDIRKDINDRIGELKQQIKQKEIERINNNPRCTTNVYYKYEELYKLQDALKALED